MDPKHRELAEEIYQMSSFVLAESGADAPLFILIKDNKSIPILIPPGTEIDTAGYIMMSLNFAREEKADAIIVVAGMWVVTGHVDDINLDVRPSEQESREHYLNLVYMSSDGSELESIAGKVETDPAGTKYVRHHEWMDSVQDFEWLQPWKQE